MSNTVAAALAPRTSDVAGALKALIKGDVATDDKTLTEFSRDKSIFERRPRVVVFPKDAEDVSAIVRYVREARARGEDVSIAPRSAGTDMTGGPLTNSIALVFTRHMDHMGEVRGDSANAEPGVMYRDFEKATIEKSGKIMPSYPASRELCALGGMVGNNAGGELTLRYGQTSNYVRELGVVLSDGSSVRLRPLTLSELEAKKGQRDLEGEIYRGMDELLKKNAMEIEAARPNVSKNSSGYALWNVWNKEHDVFDLTQLIAGSQGTLAIMTDLTMGLVSIKREKAMLVIFLKDMELLPEVVQRVLRSKPEAFESYDDQTWRLAVRFLPQIISHFGIWQMIKLAFSFIPEMWIVLTGGVPKLVLMAEFAEDTHEEALRKAIEARAALAELPLRTELAKSETAAAKYWTIRRESFSLLRKNLRGYHAAPFIDDLVVHPADYPLFLPELHAILEQYDLIYTIAGHIGDADFHIIPLMDLSKPEAREAIMELDDKVYKLIAKYKGSITGEHNDGIIRTPYLPLIFSPRIIELFAEVKRIFDPLGIFNPGKKVGGSIEDVRRSMLTHS